MTNYVFIQNLFSTILKQSRAIEGRFFIGHNYGLQEINYDHLGQDLDNLGLKDKKYPLVLMAPPHSTFNITEDSRNSMRKEDGWEDFRILMFFMKTTGYNSDNRVQNPSSKTKLTTHTVIEDWHDMKRCAIGFLRSLSNLQRNNPNPIFRLPSRQVLFIPLSNIGSDKVAGIRADFDFRLFVGCELEDYDDYPTLEQVNLPKDGHPEHAL